MNPTTPSLVLHLQSKEIGLDKRSKNLNIIFEFSIKYSILKNLDFDSRILRTTSLQANVLISNCVRCLDAY